MIFRPGWDGDQIFASHALSGAWRPDQRNQPPHTASIRRAGLRESRAAPRSSTRGRGPCRQCSGLSGLSGEAVLVLATHQAIPALASTQPVAPGEAAKDIVAPEPENAVRRGGAD